MEVVKVTITTDVPISIRVTKIDSEKEGLSKLLCAVKKAEVRNAAIEKANA